MHCHKVFIAFWLLAWSVIATQAQNQEETIRLMLDTGGHMAPVIDLAITPDGKQIVSASNDKTVRIWDIDSGQTLRVIRGETGPGSWGAIYAMALSPDGRWIAVGGFLSQADRPISSSVRLYDFATGKQAALLTGHDNVVQALAFSRDSERLISGSVDKSAIVWDLRTRRQLSQLSGHTEPVTDVAFSNNGEAAVTASKDGILRLWSVGDGKLIAEMDEHKKLTEKEAAEIAQKTTGQNKPSNDALKAVSVESLAVSPVGDVIASGSSDGRILLWNGRTGAFLRQLANPGGMVGISEISALRFSPDGQWLLSASNFQGCELYEVATGAEMVKGALYDAPPTIFDNVRREKCVNAVAFSPDGKLAASGYNNRVNLLDGRTNSPIKVFQGVGATVQGVGFAQDGKTIAWGHTLGKGGEFATLSRKLRLPLDGMPLTGPVMIGEADADVEPVSVADGDYLRRTDEHDGLSVGFKSVGSGLINSRYLEIFKAGARQAEVDLENLGPSGTSPMSLTFDGATVLFGGTPDIGAFDLKGDGLGSFVGHTGMVRDIVPSTDGRYLLSGAADQTARLWNLNTRELIVSIFDGADGEWVMWTPQGYYASSPNGDRIVGWQINRGPEREADFVRASQLRHQFYRPDIIRRAIALVSATQAIEEAGLAQSRNFKLSDLVRHLPPRLDMIAPGPGAETSSGRIAVAFELFESPGDPVTEFAVFVNGIKVAAAARRDGNRVGLDVPLGQGENHIRIVARSTASLLGEAVLFVTQNGEGVLDKRDTLYILAIGADRYPNLPKQCGASGNSACDLSFAGADARAFAETVEQQMGSQHRQVIKRMLVNGAGDGLEPTRDNIENALDLLLQAQDNDTIAVFIAGHGIDDPRTGYQFLPSDVRPGVGGHFASSSVVKWAVLDNALQTARGRRLLFVDTCRSGNAFNARLMKDASDGAIVAFSATNTQQDALELASLGHGVFTSALIAGLNGAADLAQENEVRVFDLGAFLEREVRKLTKGRQTPDFYKKPGAENFVLVRM